jgi:hypothetical protein
MIARGQADCRVSAGSNRIAHLHKLRLAPPLVPHLETRRVIRVELQPPRRKSPDAFMVIRPRRESTQGWTRRPARREPRFAPTPLLNEPGWALNVFWLPEHREEGVRRARTQVSGLLTQWKIGGPAAARSA